MDELIQQIQTAFKTGVPDYRINAGLFATSFGTTQDNGLETVANLFALSNGWEATVTRDWISFKPKQEQGRRPVPTIYFPSSSPK